MIAYLLSIAAKKYTHRDDGVRKQLMYSFFEHLKAMYITYIQFSIPIIPL